MGSYEQVAEELARYIALGYITFILDVPPSEEELHHVKIVFDRASQMQTEKGVVSVPSVIRVLSRMRLLLPGSFPSLRYSLFCGEPLAASYAQLWQEAAHPSL